MLKSDAAAYLAGVTQVEGAQASAPTNLHVITGEVGQKSEDGKTTVSVDGLVFSEEDSQEIEMDTLGGLEEGDIATIILTGEAGHGMTPLAIGAVGSVDRINAKVIETQLLLADKADIQDLTAATARIDDLEADHVTVNDFTAATGRIGDLEADNVTINGRLQAAELDIDGIQADYLKAADLQAEQARVGNLLANKADVSDLTAATGRISDLEADHVSVDDFEAATGRIDDLEADHIGTSDLQAEQARVDNLLANKASVSDLNAAKGRISDLEADHVTVADFQAEQANIDTLQANTADIAIIRANSAKVQNLTAAQLEADHATVGSLSTTYATVANLNAANGRITNLESTKANISDLEADYITADVIEATYMHANMSNSDVAWIENGTIKNGAIVSAMINDVSANKLTAGTINGSVINVTNLNADNITTGTINGQRIGEGSLSLSKLDESVYTEAEVNNIVDGLNDRIDGAIETFTGTAVPTLNNSPASSWNTTKLRDEHVGDVYYVVNSQSQQNGYCYRFTKSGSNYSWQLIKDSDVTAALSRLTTAEGKITTFDSDISTLKTDTGTLTTKTESLETSLGDKVDVTTFNDVSDTVDQHSQTISQMSETISSKADGSTVTSLTNRVSKNEQDITGVTTTLGEIQNTLETKADGSTVETVSNRLNTVSNTVDGHTQTLTNVQNTLEAKADGSTVSTLQEDYATYKQTTTENVSSIGTRLTTAEGKISTAESNITQNATNINAKVSKNDVINQINLSTEGVLIDADRVEINGTAVFNAIKSSTDAAYDAKGAASTAEANAKAYANSIEIGGRNLLFEKPDYYNQSAYDVYKISTSVSLKEIGTNSITLQLWGVDIDASSTFIYVYWGGWSVELFMAERQTVANGYISLTITPTTAQTEHADATNKYITIFNAPRGHSGASLSIERWKLEKGDKPTDWSPAPEDIASRTQRIWYRWNSATAPAAPTSWVTKGDDGSALWTKMHVAITSTHKYIYTCEQYEMADGTLGHTDVLLDNTITVIDGGNIITGTVTANKLNAADINASKSLTVGAMTDAAASTILNSNLQVGGDNLIGRFNLNVTYNSTYDYTTGTMTSTTTTNTADSFVYLHLYNGSTYVRQLSTSFGSSYVGKLCGWTFEKTSDFNIIRVKFNGNKADSDCRWNISSVVDGMTLTFSFRLDSLSSDGAGNGGMLRGINLRTGNMLSEWSLAPQDETIGGRNLLRGTGDAFPISAQNSGYYTDINVNNGKLPYAYTLEAGVEYTFSADVTSDVEPFMVSVGAGNNTYAKDIIRVYDLTSGRIKATFTPTTAQLANGAVLALRAPRYATSQTSYTYTVDNVKLEKGNKATDWTPAPEDVDADISDAAKTASNYITTIDTTNGIKIANASPSSATTYLQLASNFLDFIRGGVSMLKAWIDETTATAKVRVGAESGFNTLTDDEGIKLREGTDLAAKFTKSEITLCGGAGRIAAGNSGAISIIGEQPRLIGKTADDTSAAMFYVGKTNGTNYAGITAWSDTNTSAVNIQLYPVIDGLYSVPTLSIQSDGGSGDFAVTDFINAIPVTLYDNASASASAAATLSESAANFKRLTIFFKDQDNTYGSVDVWNPNGKRVSLDLTWINGTSTQQMYQRVRWVTISGTTISTFKNSSDANYRTGQVRLGGTYSVTNSDYISIVHVIGYR